VRERVAARDDGIEHAFDRAEIAEVGSEEASFDPETLGFASCPFDFPRAEFGADDAVLERRKTYRLCPDTTGAVEDRASVGKQVADQAVMRCSLTPNSGLTFSTAGPTRRIDAVVFSVGALECTVWLPGHVHLTALCSKPALAASSRSVMPTRVRRPVPRGTARSHQSSLESTG